MLAKLLNRIFLFLKYSGPTTIQPNNNIDITIKIYSIAFMPDLLTNHWFKDEDLVALKWVFDQLGLPEPKDKEAVSGTAHMMFLSCFGIVARIYRQIPSQNHVDDVVPLIRHPHMLRPLASFKAGPNFRVDLQPGAPVGTNGLDAYKAYETLHQDGYEVSDIMDYSRDELLQKLAKIDLEKYPDYFDGANTLYLPRSPKTIEFPKGFPVCFDPNGIEFLNEYVGTISSMLTSNVYNLSPSPHEQPDIQDHLYGHIRQAFTQACIPGRKDLDKEKIQAAWKLCALETQNAQGVLSSPWTTQNSDIDHKDLYLLNYQRKLESSKLIAPVLASI